MPQKEEVRAMFNAIAPKYDSLNHILSLGIDRVWRKRLIKKVLKSNPDKVLDVATGTADLAIALAKKDAHITIDGVDIAEEMLSIGHDKLAKKGLLQQISLHRSSAEELPMESDLYDVGMVAFGVRNFENPTKGLAEIHRTLRPGGKVFVLEFTMPKAFIIKHIYLLYFTKVLPWIGRRVSGHQSAYTYLPQSVQKFAEREEFLNMLKQVGFTKTQYTMQGLGIAAIYEAVKEPIITSREQ